MYRVSVDVGGTFTDLVALDESSGEVINIKTPSVPKNPEQGVVNAVEAFLGSHGADSVRMIGHATTIATNALFGQVDLDLPRTGLVTTKGFMDVIEIGRQRRAEVYNLFFERPPMLVKRRHRYEVNERIRHDGVVEKDIRISELNSVIERLSMDKVESVAVGFINSYANTVHEERVKQAIKDKLLLVGSGTSDTNITEALRYADGAIVGTYFKGGGVIENPVEKDRVTKLIKMIR